MENNRLPAISSEIILGQPSVGCQGHGICKIITQSLTKKHHCKSIKTIITLGSDKKLRFFFYKSALSSLDKEKHFKEPWFQIHEPVSLPDSIIVRFNHHRTRILPGKYPILENARFFIVTL